MKPQKSPQKSQTTQALKIKKIITDDLDWYFLCHTGYRKINGGYAEVRKLKIKKLKDNWYNVKGYLVSGEQDCGSGHSAEYTDEIEIEVKIENNKLVERKEVIGV
jgi:hypothetical protein